MDHNLLQILLKAIVALDQANDSLAAGMDATANARIKEARELIGTITLADLTN